MAVDRDPDRAIAMVTPDMLRIGVVGTAEELIPRLERLAALGARHRSFGPPLGPDPFEAIEVLGRDVLPRFAPRAPPDAPKGGWPSSCVPRMVVR